MSYLIMPSDILVSTRLNIEQTDLGANAAFTFFYLLGYSPSFRSFASCLQGFVQIRKHTHKRVRAYIYKPHTHVHEPVHK